jgi:citrate lyase beta subunit
MKARTSNTLAVSTTMMAQNRHRLSTLRHAQGYETNASSARIRSIAADPPSIAQFFIGQSDVNTSEFGQPHELTNLD